MSRIKVIKTADGKGRVVLGKDFANKTLVVNQISPTKVVIEIARVIPEREMWLWENEVAIASVQRGLNQAHAGELVEGPDAQADLAAFGDDE